MKYLNKFTNFDDYKIIKIKKSSGKIRTIYEPNQKLKELQKKSLYEHVYKLPVSFFAHGFVVGRNIVTNAMPHVKKKYLFKFDIKNFFDNLRYTHFKQYCRPEDKTGSNLKHHFICDVDNYNKPITFLPQGAPASPAISNAMLFIFDITLARYLINLEEKSLNNLNLDFSRYADDITISSNCKKVFKSIKEKIELFLYEFFSLELNQDKVKIISRAHQQRVCGIVVNDKVNISRKERKRLRAINFQIRNNIIENNNHFKGLNAYHFMVDKFRNQPVASLKNWVAQIKLKSILET